VVTLDITASKESQSSRVTASLVGSEFHVIWLERAGASAIIIDAGAPFLATAVAIIVSAGPRGGAFGITGTAVARSPLSMAEAAGEWGIRKLRKRVRRPAMTKANPVNASPMTILTGRWPPEDLVTGEADFGRRFVVRRRRTRDDTGSRPKEAQHHSEQLCAPSGGRHV
jgi:hypothetical protein